jgi:aminoglycoside-2''-adenylyltransferase
MLARSCLPGNAHAVSTPPPELRVSEILRQLTEASVDFVVIGGIAVVLLGSARNTKDLDITFATDQANLEALGQVLKSLNARLRGVHQDVPFVPDARTLRQVSLLTTLDTDAGWLDLLAEPPGGPPYATLRANATELDLDGFDIRVADIDDMIKMKSIAGRLQDLADIDELVTIKRLRQKKS